MATLVDKRNDRFWPDKTKYGMKYLGSANYNSTGSWGIDLYHNGDKYLYVEMHYADIEPRPLFNDEFHRLVANLFPLNKNEDMI